MNGIIKFSDLNQLAEFLQAFVGSTAIFEVYQNNDKDWVLRFTGGF